MPPSKRWYQLSMLQTMVAMAVVAVFTFKNSAYRSSPNHNDIDLISAGWPFEFLVGYGTLATTTSEFVRARDPIFAGMPRYNPWMMTLNVAICSLTAFMAVRTVAYITRRLAKSQRVNS